MISRVNINVANIRSEPNDRSERLTQALYYETVEILEEKDNWLKVRLPDPYVGWLRKPFAGEPEINSVATPFHIIVGLAPALEQPEITSRHKTFIPYCCEIIGKEVNDFVQLVSQRYGTMYIPTSCVETVTQFQRTAAEWRSIFQLECEKFLGVPYLWGGKSFFGIDCSGFSQTVMRRFGIALPRDSKDQINSGVPVDRENIVMGGLLFFPRHVAIALGNDIFIHSSVSNGGVAINSFDKNSKFYNEYLDKSFICARRVFQ